MKFAKKKKINKTEEVFKEALIQAESAYLTKIGKDLPPGQYKCRKWKYIERNKGFGLKVLETLNLAYNSVIGTNSHSNRGFIEPI